MIIEANAWPPYSPGTMGESFGRLDMALKTSQQRILLCAGAILMAFVTGCMMAFVTGCTDPKPPTSVLPPASNQASTPPREKAHTISTPKVRQLTRTDVKPKPAAQPPTVREAIVPTIQRLRGEQVERFHVSRGTRFITLAGKGGVIQTIDGLRGRIIAERRIAPEILCDGNAVSTDGRQILTRRGRRVQMTNVFDGKVSYLGEPHAGRPKCTLDGDGLRVVELSQEGARITHLQSQKTTSIPAPETGRVRRILADRTARVIVADATTEQGDIWLVFGGGGGTFWRALDRTRGGNSMAISESGRWFITAYGEKQLQQWDLDSDQVVATWPFRRIYQFQGHDERVLVETNTGGLALVDRASGEIVAQLALEFDVTEAAIDTAGQRLLAFGKTPRIKQQVIGSWDIDSSSALFVKRFPMPSVTGVTWQTETLRITTGQVDLNVDTRTGRQPAKPPVRIPSLDGVTLTREGTAKVPRVRVRMGGNDAVALDTEGTLLVSHRTETELLAAVWRANAAAAPEALVMVERGRLITLKDAKATVTAQLKTVVVALATDAQGHVFGVGRAGNVLEFDPTGTATTRARLPRRVASAAMDITPDGDTAVVVTGSQGYRIDLKTGGQVAAQFLVPPIARHVAISADGTHISTSDGVDVFTFDAAGQPKAVVRLLPSSRTIVTAPDGSRLLPKTALSSVRLRKGDRLLNRSSPEFKTAWEQLTQGDIPL